MNLKAEKNIINLLLHTVLIKIKYRSKLKKKTSQSKKFEYTNMWNDVMFGIKFHKWTIYIYF